MGEAEVEASLEMEAVMEVEAGICFPDPLD